MEASKRSHATSKMEKSFRKPDKSEVPEEQVDMSPESPPTQKPKQDTEQAAVTDQAQERASCSIGNRSSQVDFPVVRTDLGFIKIPEVCPESALWYNMPYENAGESRRKCFIFNFWKFIAKNQRRGTGKDKERITKLFKEKLYFDVQSYDNLTRQEMLEKLNLLAGADYSDTDCFCLFVLSHGEDDAIVCSDDELTKIEEIYYLFAGRTCQGLVGKPKLFYIQACRGNKTDKGVRHDAATPLDSSADSESAKTTLPTLADIFIFYATTPGLCSYRDEIEGSFFIQTLCQVIERDYRYRDFRTMMTLVKYYLAEHTIQYEGQEVKQMPATASTLTKNFSFVPHENKMNDETAGSRPTIHPTEESGSVANTVPVTGTESNVQPPSPRIERNRQDPDAHMNMEIVSPTEIEWRPKGIRRLMKLAPIEATFSIRSAWFQLCGYTFELSLTSTKSPDGISFDVCLALCSSCNDDNVKWPFETPYTITLRHPSDDEMNISEPGLFHDVNIPAYLKPRSARTVGVLQTLLPLAELVPNGYVLDDALWLIFKLHPQLTPK